MESRIFSTPDSPPSEARSGGRLARDLIRPYARDVGLLPGERHLLKNALMHAGRRLSRDPRLADLSAGELGRLFTWLVTDARFEGLAARYVESLHKLSTWAWQRHRYEVVRSLADQRDEQRRAACLTT